MAGRNLHPDPDRLDGLNMTDTFIDIIRHGEPEGGRRYRGHGIDDPLSDRGWQQMWAAIPDTPIWDHIITSPLSRCQQFAQTLAEKTGIDYSIDEQLKEIGFGVWEGKTPEDILANEGDALERFIEDPVHNRPQDAEPLDEFASRVWMVYENVAQDYKGKHILLVAHAGVIRAITSKILGMPLDDVYSRLKIEYAAIASTRIHEKKPPVMVLKA